MTSSMYISALTLLLTVMAASASLDQESLYIHPLKALHQIRQRARSMEHIKLDRTLVKELSSNLDPEILLQSAAGLNLNISEGCSNAIIFLLEYPSTTDKFKFFDSWGKLGNGIFTGHTNYPGMFDECVGLTLPLTSNNTWLKQNFTSKYCTATIPFMGIAELNLGVCAPKQCSGADLSALYESVLDRLIPTIKVKTTCHDLTKDMPAGDVFVLVFIMIVIGICVAATLFEGALQLRKSWMAKEFHGMSVKQEEATPLLGEGGKPVSSFQRDDSEKPSTLTKIILAFSLYSNTKNLMNTTQPKGAISCLNGIRFFSLTWVIIGHTILFYSHKQLNNGMWLLDPLLKNFASQVIFNATVSVDTFFVLSGLLVGYLFLKDFHKRQIRVCQFFIALPMMYLHRYIRLTPAYAYMILIWTCLLWYSWDGPTLTQDPSRSADPNCVNNWYLNILYVNNVFDIGHQCAGWGWYLANDTQFFLVAPFLVFVFYLSSVIGSILISVTIFFSCLAATIVSYEQGLRFTLAPTANVSYTSPSATSITEPEYDVPWTRYQTYGVGLLAGCLLWNLKQKNFKIPTLLNLAGWGVAATLAMSVIYGPYNANMGYHVVYIGEAMMYEGLSRTAWGIAVAWVMISCGLGQGGWIDDFLSWRAFVPLSRLTYCAYLIHLPIIFLMGFGARNGVYYTYVQLASDCLLMITIAFLTAYPFSLIFEQPYIMLDKLFLVPRSLKGQAAAIKPGQVSAHQNGSDYQSIPGTHGQQSVGSTNDLPPPYQNSIQGNNYGANGVSVKEA